MPLPPFLLGVALLFWGVMTDRLWIGALIAVVVEASRFWQVRWPFGEKASVRAWRLCVLIMVITLALVLMERVDPRAMSRVFSWLPLILLPLQFVQNYGTSPVMDLGTFSLMVRRRREHAEKFGLPFRQVTFSFSKVYLACILISSSLGSNAANKFYFPLMVIFIGLALVSTMKFSWRYLPVVLGLSLLPAGLAAFAGQKSLMALYARLLTGGAQQGDDRTHVTSMGDLGELKQSQEILWRVKAVNGMPPRLLRLMSYQTYSDTRWFNDDFPPGVPSYNRDWQALREVQNPDNPLDTEDKFVLCSADDPNLALIKRDLPRFHLQGSLPVKNVIPLPGGAASFHGMGLYTDLDINSVGAVRLDSVESVVDTDVLWSPDLSTERPPWQRLTQRGPTRKALSWPDLEVPEKEREAVEEVVRLLNLREGTVEEKIEKVRSYFQDHFEYSRYVDAPNFTSRSGSVVTSFLQKTKRGHCEFFATAATLILRQAGVPARYTSGFAAIEFDSGRKERIIRGVHAHAWCRAWDAASHQWIDVDATPADWTAKDAPPRSGLQAMSDWLKIQKESFIVWRSKPGRLMLITVILLTPVSIGLAVIGRILWKSRQKVERAAALRRGATDASFTPLNDLERPARRVLGKRPAGRPLAAWLEELRGRLEKPEVLAEALALHQQMRFDPAGAAGESTGRKRLAGLAAELKSMLKQLPKHREG